MNGLPNHNTSIASFTVLPAEPRTFYLEMGRNMYSGVTMSQTKFSGFKPCESLPLPSASVHMCAHEPAHIPQREVCP